MSSRLRRAPLHSHSPILDSLVECFEAAASRVLRSHEPIANTAGITLQVGNKYFYLGASLFNTKIEPFLQALRQFDDTSSANDSGNVALDQFATSVRNILASSAFPHPLDKDCLYAPYERGGNIALRTRPFLRLLDIANQAQTLDALPESLKNSAQILVQNFPLKPPKNPLLPGRNLEDDYTPTATYN